MNDITLKVPREPFLEAMNLDWKRMEQLVPNLGPLAVEALQTSRPVSLSAVLAAFADFFDEYEDVRTVRKALNALGLPYALGKMAEYYWRQTRDKPSPCHR